MISSHSAYRHEIELNSVKHTSMPTMTFVIIELGYIDVGYIRRMFAICVTYTVYIKREREKRKQQDSLYKALKRERGGGEKERTSWVGEICEKEKWKIKKNTYQHRRSKKPLLIVFFSFRSFFNHVPVLSISTYILIIHKTKKKKKISILRFIKWISEGKNFLFNSRINTLDTNIVIIQISRSIFNYPFLEIRARQQDKYHLIHFLIYFNLRCLISKRLLPSHHVNQMRQGRHVMSNKSSISIQYKPRNSNSVFDYLTWRLMDDCWWYKNIWKSDVYKSDSD